MNVHSIRKESILDKREAIQQAALELFAERGFYGTPVPLIVEKAHVGAGTVYRYFRDKVHLVNELYRYWKTSLFETITIDLPSDIPLRSMFHKIWLRWVNFVLENPVAYMFLEAHHHSPYLDEANVEMNEHIYQSFGEILKHGHQQEVFKDVPPELLIVFITGVMNQFAKDYWAGRFQLTPEIIEQAEEMCWQAIRR